MRNSRYKSNSPNWQQIGLWTTIAVTSAILIAAIIMLVRGTILLEKTYVTNTTNHITDDISLLSFNNLINYVLNNIYVTMPITDVVVKNVSSGDNTTVSVDTTNISYPVVTLLFNDSGDIQIIQNGTGILINDTDPLMPSISTTAILTAISIAPILIIDDADPQHLLMSLNSSFFLGVRTIRNGTGIAVDNADPEKPILSSLAVLDAEAGNYISINKTDPQNLVVSINQTAFPIIVTIQPGLGIAVDDSTPTDPIISNTGAYNVTGIFPVVIDNTNTQYPIVSIDNQLQLQATLYTDIGTYGDPFLLTNQVYGVGFYQDIPRTTWTTGGIANFTNTGTPEGTWLQNMAIDQDDNVYMSGYSQAVDFTVNSITYPCVTSGGANCALIVKSDIDGNWLNAFVGYTIGTDITADVQSNYISTDLDNNIYVAGYFNSAGWSYIFGNTTFPVQNCNPGFCAWWMKLDSSLNMQWITATSSAIFGSGFKGLAIETDGDYTYVYAGRDSASGPFDLGECTGLDISGFDSFMAKLYSINGSCIWVSPISGPAISVDEVFCQMDIQSSNDILVAGTTTSTVSANGLSVPCAVGGNNCFYIARINSSGTWTQIIGNNTGYFSDTFSGVDQNVCGFTTDSNGNMYLSGGYASDPNMFGSIPSITTAGNTNFFIAKLAANGTWLDVTPVVQPNIGKSFSGRLSIDINDNLYVCGRFYSNITFGSTQLSYDFGGDTDTTMGPFVAKVSTDLNFLWVYTATSYLSSAKTVNMGGWQTAVSSHTNNVFMSGLTQRSPVFDNVQLVPQTIASVNPQGYWVALVQLPIPPSELVILTQSGVFGDTLTAVTSGLITGMTGLTPAGLYYYDLDTQTIVTTPTNYTIGYAFSATELYFDPQPIYIIMT